MSTAVTTGGRKYIPGSGERPKTNGEEKKLCARKFSENTLAKNRPFDVVFRRRGVATRAAPNGVGGGGRGDAVNLISKLPRNKSLTGKPFTRGGGGGGGETSDFISYTDLRRD